MPKRTRVDVERVRELHAELERLNALPLHLVDLWDGGRKLHVHDVAVQQWVLSCRGLVEFVVSGAYRQRPGRLRSTGG